MEPRERGELLRIEAVRDQTIATLQHHFAHGHLDVEAFERRVTEAHTRESAADIESLVADLSPAGGVSTALTQRSGPLVPRSGGESPGEQTLRGFMSATTRGGPWAVPRRLSVRSLMSSTVLDFSEATWPAGPVELEINALMSSVEIIVPPGLAVNTEGAAFMGVFEAVHRAPATPDPEQPLLRIRGKSILASVEVKMALPPAVHGQRPALESASRAPGAPPAKG